MRYWSVIPAIVLSACLARADGDPFAKAPSKFAPYGDAKVHYKSLGDGATAVVFVHGWCCDHTVWTEQAAALDGKVRVIAVDLPGYGKSDKPKVEYTMDYFAKGIDAVLQDAGVERAVLVGHSMGTPVVRQYYRLYPKKTQALIFVDGGLRSFVDKAQGEQFLSMFKEETFKDVAPQLLSSMLPEGTPPANRKKIESLVENTSPMVAISSMKNMLDGNHWKEDPIKVPCQALMAKAPFWTEDYKEFVRKLAPGIDYREFDDVGHFLFMDKPKEFNEAMIEFLKKQGVVR